MDMNDVGIEFIQQRAEPAHPCVAVLAELVRTHVRPSCRAIGHDVGHPWHGERQFRRFEAKRVNMVVIQTADLGKSIVRRNAHHHLLLPSGCRRVAYQGIEGDARPGQ